MKPLERTLMRGLFLSLLLMSINTVTTVVLEDNLGAGLYRPIADTIAIPIAGTQLSSIVLSPFLLLIAYIPIKFKKIFSRNSKFEAMYKSAGAILIAYTPVFPFVLYGALYWTSPNHMQIACLYYAAFLCLFALVFIDITARKKLQNGGN
tara:strand:- start:606 stop:1055 length:450 start_codon:yes stop_codon:yes gene_type:complete